MPRATNNISDLVHVDLTSCPGGFVDLRRMTYGQYLHRQQMAMDMKMETGTKKGAGASMDINMAQDKVAAYEFKTCIAAHNLEDENGQPLDFSSPVAVQILDVRIGQEIGDAIDGMSDYKEVLGN
jgi:hypothetical protein